ncbi:hypothetical protein DUI87_03909 [Hirundo rustica rustica]|uniref:Uncharacterized protein n=1 Tax=Hirundo rustica rustica TaxID=333673 RepID=A0A3M0L178_HIRRU|nr:hypothetical protein DUI87_03909 [Hirundo rustica rustica]
MLTAAGARPDRDGAPQPPLSLPGSHGSLAQLEQGPVDSLGRGLAPQQGLCSLAQLSCAEEAMPAYYLFPGWKKREFSQGQSEVLARYQVCCGTLAVIGNRDLGWARHAIQGAKPHPLTTLAYLLLIYQFKVLFMPIREVA